MVVGLRELADFLERNEDFPYRIQGRTINFMRWTDGKEEIAKIAHMLGNCQKFTNKETIGLRKHFGAICLQFSWARHMTCRKVAIGKETMRVPDWSKQPYKDEERIKYKWVCPESFLNACCEEPQP